MLFLRGWRDMFWWLLCGGEILEHHFEAKAQAKKVNIKYSDFSYLNE